MGITTKSIKISNIIEATVEELTNTNRNQLLCGRAFNIEADSDIQLTNINIQHIGYNLENPLNLLIRVSATKIETVQHDQNDNSLLSMDALGWLKSIGYDKKSHEERMALIRAARIAYPTSPEEDMAERFFATLNMR